MTLLTLKPRRRHLPNPDNDCRTLKRYPERVYGVFQSSEWKLNLNMVQFLIACVEIFFQLMMLRVTVVEIFKQMVH